MMHDVICKEVERKNKICHKGGEEVKKLSKKEALFCKYYKDGVLAEDAAEMAGYQRRGYGNVLLQREHIQAVLQKTEQSADDEILMFLQKTMRGENGAEDIKTRIKAAELLTKQRGFLIPQEDGGVLIVDDIGKGETK